MAGVVLAAAVFVKVAPLWVSVAGIVGFCAGFAAGRIAGKGGGNE